MAPMVVGMAFVGSLAGSSCGLDPVPSIETDSTTGEAGSGGSSDGGSSSGGTEPVVDRDAPFGSGTRLRAVVLEAPGGARLLAAFHDTELDIDCNFLPTIADGYRCLPTDGTLPWRQQPGEYSLPAFSPLTLVFQASPGAACQSGTVLIDACSASPASAVSLPAVDSRCGPDGVPYVPLGIGDATLSTERCPLSESGNFQHFDAVELDPSEFAAGTVVDTDGVRRIESSDGAWMNRMLLDDQARPCTVLHDGGCVASPIAEIYDGPAFADQQCTVGALPADLPEPRASDCAYEPAFAREAPTTTLRPIVGKAGILWELRESGDCESRNFLRRFLAGAPDDDPLPTATSLEEGDGPLVARHLTRDAARVEAGFWQRDLGRPCRVSRLDSGLACVVDELVVGSEVPGQFHDAQCRVPAWSADTERSVLILGRGSDRCLGVGEFVAHEAIPTDTNLYYVDSDGDCLEAGATAFAYRAGDSVDIAPYVVPLTTVTE